MVLMPLNYIISKFSFKSEDFTSSLLNGVESIQKKNNEKLNSNIASNWLFILYIILKR